MVCLCDIALSSAQLQPLSPSYSMVIFSCSSFKVACSLFIEPICFYHWYDLAHLIASGLDDMAKDRDLSNSY